MTHPSLSYLRNILNTDLVQFLNSTAALTLFLPVDKAWEALPHYERLYLESKYATDDLTKIVNKLAVETKKRRVHYSDSFKDSPNRKPAVLLNSNRPFILLTVTTIDGQKLKIRYSDEDKKTTVSDADLVEPDIYASNGVVHTVSSLLVPLEDLQLTPEKYLLVLNCSSLVSLIHSVNLTSLINDTHSHWTILAPRDDVIGFFEDDDLPPRGSEELKKLLQYHFIPGKKTSKKLKNGMLLETALEEPGLAGSKQVLSVDVGEEDEESKKSKSISFGGASVLGDPGKLNSLFGRVSC